MGGIPAVRGGARDGGACRYGAGDGEDVQEDEEEAAERGD